MDGFDNDPNGLPTGVTTDITDVSTIQFTNNLDGVLRNGYGNPIALDPRDFRHQAYYGDNRNYSESCGKLRKYVFKDGRLIESQAQPNDAIVIY